MTVPGRNTIDELMAAVPAPNADSLARLHADLVARSDRAELLDVAYRTVDSPLGPLLLAATPAGVVRVAFERLSQRGLGHEDQVLAVAKARNDLCRRLLSRKLTEILLDVLDLEGTGLEGVLLDQVLHQWSGL